MPLTTIAFLQTCSIVEGYVDLGLLQEAEAVIEALPAEFRRSKRAILLSIRLLQKRGDYLEASYLAESLALNDPTNVKHQLLVARCRLQAGKTVDALWWLQAHAAQCSNSPDYHYLRAQCHAAVGDPEAAGTELQTAHELERRPRWKTSSIARDKPLNDQEGSEVVNCFFGPKGNTQTR